MWVTFKYEWLPIFCFDCGVMGHDNKHCHMKRDRQNANPPYGDWMRVGEASKGGPDRIKSSISRSKGSNKEENNKGKVQVKVERGRAAAQTESGNFKMPTRSQSLGVEDMEMSDNPLTKNQVGWDRKEKEVQELRQIGEAREGQEGTNSDLVRALFEMNEKDFSRVGWVRKPTEKAQEDNSPIGNKNDPKENEIRNFPKMETEKRKKAQGMGRWKQVARGKGKAQELVISAQIPLVGTKGV